VGDARASHVTRWLDECYGEFGDNYRNGAVRAIKWAFNWSVEQELIDRNPAANVETPPYCLRETWLTPEQWKKVVALVKPTDPFHDLLVFLYRSGCRPFEARIAEARHFDGSDGSLVFRVKDSKGKRYRRVIPLEGEALAIVQRLALKYPDGRLFRNGKSGIWTPSAIDHRFSKLSKKVGFKLLPYQLRHSWAPTR
jgi:integrase